MSLPADVRDLADRTAIGELLDRYADAIDSGRFAAVREVFSDDADLDFTSTGGPRGGPDDLVPWLEASFEHVQATQHVITNRRITLEGNEATCVSSLFNPLVPLRGDTLLIGGIYHDRCVRTDSGWRIASRRFEFVWSAAAPPVDLGGMPAP